MGRATTSKKKESHPTGGVTHHPTPKKNKTQEHKPHTKKNSEVNEISRIGRRFGGRKLPTIISMKRDTIEIGFPKESAAGGIGGEPILYQGRRRREIVDTKKGKRGVASEGDYSDEVP